MKTPKDTDVRVSVLILTLNEEKNLPRCLASVAWCTDIVVLDSGSTDRTIEIAKAAGARVVHRVLDNWSAHQNWAVQNIKFANNWVLYIDADEVANAELAREVAAISASDSPHVAYRMRRKEMLWGKWIRHSSMYPVWHLRFFRPGKVRWERLVHPQAVADGSVGRLTGHLIHDSFSKGLAPWIEKHIDYALLEAQEALRAKHRSIDLLGLVSRSDPSRRRRALKEVSWQLWFRPTFRFLYMYALRLGFLDGHAGFCYCRLVAMYEHMIDCNVRELRRRAKGLSI